MRWLVVGASGMLGQEMVALLGARGEDVVGTTRTELDVTDPVAVGTVVHGYDIVVNCTAYAAVDAAETDEPAAFAVNAVAASSLARASNRSGARLVHISTDYVFDGHADQPYAEDAAAAPRSAYGRTKVAGEWAVRAECPDHLLVRTAWLYGAHGACFPKTIARAARERGSLDVVADQLGQPTWTADLADLVHRLVQAGVPAGTYHGTSSGSTSWHGFAAAVVGAAGMDPAIVHPTTSEAFVRPAPRPAFSVLGHDALRAAGIEPIGAWEDRWVEAAPSVLA
ncbi:dTDP-4-dehydrorhamnose reductase [Cellulomonas sp.]|uniref:dTDP-4-dehydrorhamnose reductase n=1 Tax=Cellulomonas sp. TaxID=40001 RepID=UPI003BAAD575